MRIAQVLGAIATTTTVLVASLVVTAAPASAEDTTAAELLSRLRVAVESGTGYDRDLFEHWVDADADGCDTRREVLIAESIVTATVGAGCTVSGQWTSWYDGATWTDPADVDVDHVVPLAEAWGSGASAWSSTQRRDFANDLVIGESLEAVTDEVNASKSDGDPAEWLPPVTGEHCRYALAWTTVKFRWSLSVDTAERDALSDLMSGSCGATVVSVPAVAVQVPVAPPVVVPVPSTRSQLTPGQTLASGTQLTSADGRYLALMQADGNFVVYSPSRALYNTRTPGNPGARLVLQTDGNLVVYSTAGRPLFHTRTAGQAAARLVLQDDGNLVLYSTSNRALWNTGADRPPAPAPTPPAAPSGSTVASGQTLAGGQQVRSPNGRYRLLMQTDGNLVTYSPTRALWSSRTPGNAGARLVMQGDGNGVVYTTTGRAVFQTRTAGSTGARLVIQDDGNLVVYSAAGRPLWNTGPEATVVAPPAPPAPTPPPAPSPPSVSCVSAYPDFCIPAGPDLDCPYVRTLPGFRAGFRVLPPDPFRLDGSDNDGRGCE